ncbi:hypothetical protein X752_21185 [Mesorhizobium sp. LNJC398B00]|nr:hypothetical protein X752_21185 [Mesorhizobium sp. LNJC398B00]
MLEDILASSCTQIEIELAISRSFGSTDKFAILTLPHNNLSKKKRFRAQVGEVVSAAARKGVLTYFVAEIRRIKLGEVTFRNIADVVAVAGSPVFVSGKPGFEFQGAANRLGIVNFDDLLRRLAEIKEATCRFTLPKGEHRCSIGSGILVAEDLVLTNCHVLETGIGLDFSGKRTLPPSGLACEFDYSSSGTPTVVTPLAATGDWVIALSPKAPDERAADPSSTKDLDYALVRLAAHPTLVNGQKRCFEKPANIDPFQAGVPILVVHYPGQERLSASFGKTIQNKGPHTRVRYDADTEAGTSGSGVYRLPECSLISLHQGANRSEGYNQGIPIQSILQDSLQRGKQ